MFIGRTDAEAEALILWPPGANSQLIGKDPDVGKDLRQKEKRVSEDEIVGWHHWLNGHELEQTPGNSEGQGRLMCCSPWGCEELVKSSWLNNNIHFNIKPYHTEAISHKMNHKIMINWYTLFMYLCYIINYHKQQLETTHLSYSFYGSGIWADLNWVLCFSLSYKAAVRESSKADGLYGGSAREIFNSKFTWD